MITSRYLIKGNEYLYIFYLMRTGSKLLISSETVPWSSFGEQVVYFDTYISFCAALMVFAQLFAQLVLVYDSHIIQVWFVMIEVTIMLMSHDHNSLSPGKWSCYFKCVNLKNNRGIDILSINSLRPSDAIWWHRSGSTLAQVMAWCLTAPSHHLNQCWLIISVVQWH